MPTNNVMLGKMKLINNQHGFTLVELAIVMVIVGVLLGGFIGTLASRIESTKRADTMQQLEDIKMAILGFSSAKGRLPCPATTTSLGQEAPVTGGVCTWQHGFVPGRTLGLNGAYNSDDLLIDTWGNPIRYSVTFGNANAFTTPYTVPGAGGVKDVGMAILNPDLIVCDGDSLAGTSCSAGVNTVTGSAPFIVLSLGKDGSDFVTTTAPNSDQGENSGEKAVSANPAGENLAYTVGDNIVFVSKDFSSVDAAAGQFDDLIVWESPYILYSRMIEAGQLP